MYLNAEFGIYSEVVWFLFFFFLWQLGYVTHNTVINNILIFPMRKDKFRGKIWYILMRFNMCYKPPENNLVCQWDE